MPSPDRPTPPLREPASPARRGRLLLLAFSTLLALLLAACATPSVGTTGGILRVNITGLPAGTDADVTVTGPGNFTRTLTAGTTLRGLTPGNYTIDAADVSAGSDSYSATVTDSPTRVIRGETATATVVYRTGIGALQVDITGLPAGTDADVTVTGPDGFSETLTAGDTLRGLSPGDYTVSAADLGGSTAYDATVTPATVTVTAGATVTATVAYSVVAGTLELTITGLPAGADASVVVSGPGGYSETVSADTTLTDLTPGEYTVSTAPVTVGTYAAALYDPTNAVQIVDVVSDVSGNSQASVATDYERIEPSGRLWLGIKSAGTVDGWTDDQLATDSTGLVPDVAISGDGDRENGLAFDGDGNLWLADTDSDEIRVYAAADLSAGGSPAPLATLTSADLIEPIGIAFDADGNLWVANSSTSVGYPANGTVVRFDVDDLAGASGPTAVTAGAVITSTDPNSDTSPGTNSTFLDDSLVNPTGVAFDADGNLWVTNQRSNGVVRYDADDLSGLSGSSALANGARINSGALNIPVGIAFDGDGNLWVSNQGSADTVVRFDAANLPASGTATINANGVIQADTATRDAPAGIAFDHSGNLWVAGHVPPPAGSDPDNLVRFDDPGAIDASGSATAAATIEVGDFDGGFPTFFPAPAGLPIQTPVLTAP